VHFYFKVPNLDNDIISSEVLNGGDLPIINWSLVTPTNSLGALGSYINASDICDSKNTCSGIDFSFKQ
jgi:hypothetical protein